MSFLRICQKFNVDKFALSNYNDEKFRKEVAKMFSFRYASQNTAASDARACAPAASAARMTSADNCILSLLGTAMIAVSIFIMVLLRGLVLVAVLMIMSLLVWNVLAGEQVKKNFFAGSMKNTPNGLACIS